MSNRELREVSQCRSAGFSFFGFRVSVTVSVMANSTNILLGIKPFDGTNYANWSFRMKMVLEQSNVLEVLEKEPPTADAELKVFKSEDIKARNIIVQGLADNMLSMIKDKKTAKEMMDALSATYEKKGMKSLVQAQKLWRKLDYKKDKPLQKFLHEFETLASDVKVAGGKLGEEEMVSQLLVAMPSDFDSVVSAMDILSNKDRASVTLEYVKNTLLAEEVRITKRDDQESVFVSRGFSRGKFTKSKYTKSGESSGFNGRCYYCKMQGHMKNNCPKLKNKKPVAGVSKENDDEEEFTFLTSVEEQCTSLDCYQSLVTGEKVTSIMFIVDSGASNHLVKSEYKSCLEDIRPEDIDISVAKEGESVKASSKGNLRCCSDDGVRIRINDVLVCDSLAFNLLSVRRLEKEGCKVIFEKSSVKIVKGDKVLHGQMYGRLYIIKMNIIKEQANVTSYVNDLMHRRMGHSSKYPIGICDTCLKAKQTKLPFAKHIPDERKAKRILERVSTDVCGKVTPPTYDGYNYFVTFIDHFSHFCVTYLIKNKSDVFDKFKAYLAMAETKFKERLENLRCDRGGEYISKDMKRFCEARGIHLEYSTARNPPQNGVSERMNRTLLEKARCLIFDSGLNKEMWGEAVMTSTYLVNRLPTSALPEGILPAKRWYGYDPDLKKIKVFGCPVYSLIHKEDRKGKLSERSKRLFLVGYCDNGYRLWNPTTRKIEFARNVIFDEERRTEKTELPDVKHIVSIPEENTLKTTTNESDKEDFYGFSEDELQEILTNKKRPTRQKTKPKYLEDFVSSFALEMALFSSTDVPEKYSEAVKDESWREAVNEELKALEDNHTWELVDPPQDETIIDSKWVFTSKVVDGQVKKKARLVARGYQQPSTEEEDIFAPVARLVTLRILLSFAVEKDLQINQLDVRSAFLKSSLPVPVYMRQPEGLQCSEVKVLKLVKALYGLRQSPKVWNDCINNIFVKLGFKRSIVDPCLYAKDSTYILIWVDDFLIVSDSIEEVNSIKSQLMSKLDIKVLGSNSKMEFLGLKINRNKDGNIVLNQTSLIEKIIKKFNMTDAKVRKIPIQPKLNLEKCEKSQSYDVPYKELIGSIMYLMLGSRPDLCFAISYFGRFQNCYNETHWKHLKNIIKYLKFTINIGLVFKRSNCNSLYIHSYVDADYAHDVNDRKSTTGFILKINDNIVSWASRKQSVVALSSTEAEYYALGDCLIESLFVQKLLKDIFIYSNVINIYEDNQGTIKIAQTLETKRSKHYDVKYSFVKDMVMKGSIKINYIETKDQIADLMTKALPENKFEHFFKQINLVRI